MRGKSFAWLAVLTGAVFFVAALNVTGKASAETITCISYLDPQGVKAFQSLTERFYKETGIKVDLVNVSSSEVFTKIRVMIAGGTPPDLYAGGLYVWDLASMGVLGDFTPFLKKENVDLKDFYGPAVKAGRYQDILYGIPYSMNTTLLAYNADRVSEAGLVRPGKWGDDSWTWERYAIYAQKMTKDTNSDGQPDLYGGTPYPQRLIDIPWMFGSGWVSRDLSRIIVDEPAGIRSFQFVHDLIYSLRVSPTLDRMGGIETGRIAMSSIGTWNVPTFVRSIKGFDWNIAAMPIGTGLTEDSGYAIPSYPDGFILFNTKNKEASWRWVKFIVFDDENLRYFAANVIHQLPPVRRLVPSYVSELIRMKPNLDLQTLLAAPDHAQIQRLFLNPNMTDILVEADKRIAAMLSNPNANVDNEVKQMAKAIQQLWNR